LKTIENIGSCIKKITEENTQNPKKSIIKNVIAKSVGDGKLLIVYLNSA
jgi:hypothetical protein